MVREQAAIAVVADESGNVVIRQAGQYGPEDDMWVVVAPENALALAEAIMRGVGFEPAGPSPISEPNKPKTNAERQCAHRERKRNAAVTPPVTEREPERHGSVTGRND